MACPKSLDDAALLEPPHHELLDLGFSLSSTSTWQRFISISNIDCEALTPWQDGASHYDMFSERDIRQYLTDLVSGERRGCVQFIVR